ncbi:MAG: hypothetical protein PF693_15800 [Spirochaetia bacterium]|nr:hypothetical protein [Spirochaetia bacterium]
MSNSDSTIILWTDKPEMAAYVEEFNSVQDKYRIEIVYKKDPGNTLVKTNNQSNENVDLIISEFLNSPETLALFTPLEDVYKDDTMDMSIFYSGLLDLGYKEDELFLLPVSFNLPSIMFRKSMGNEDIPSFYMNSEDMENASKNFNEKSTTNFEVMGFSQRWETEVLFINAILMETNFKMLNTGVLSWDNQKLLNSLEYIKKWTNETNGGLEQEEEFTTKFLYDPSYKLIEESRILFYYSDIVNFFGIAPEKRKNLDFRWFAAANKIPVFGNILFSGIPEKAKNRKGAIQFIHWFFDPETQKNLLKSTQIKRMDTFGFANGFSSLPEINKNELPIIYPNLVGNIPQESSLIFPAPLPLYWNELKTKVIKPWMYEQTEASPVDKPLHTVIEEWLKQRS